MGGWREEKDTLPRPKKQPAVEALWGSWGVAVSASGPGWRSVQGLAWLARVGASSGQTWAVAMGWRPATMRSHAVRLQRAGLIRRAPRVQGTGGGLLYATPAGVLAAGVGAVPLRKAATLVSGPHHEACAQVAAYLSTQGREMLGPREVLRDERWVAEVQWREHGELRRRRHRADLAVVLEGERWMAIEVELTAKSPARLRSILEMYRAWLTEGRVDSVLYIAGTERERTQLRREAPGCGLVLGPRFGVQLIDQLNADLTATQAELVASSRERESP
jgi:hypothetical protein